MPRPKEVVGVVTDALLEGQQGVPLALYAAPARRMELPCVGDEEEAVPGRCHIEDFNDPCTCGYQDIFWRRCRGV